MGIHFGGIICPFVCYNHTPNELKGNMLADHTDWRCRCGAYYNVNSIIRNEKIYCNVCRVSKQKAQVVDPRLLQLGCVDLLVSAEPNTIYYVFVFEISKETAETHALYTALEAIKAALLTINQGSIKLVLIGHTATELRFFHYDQKINEVKMTISRQFDQFIQKFQELGCPLQNAQDYLNLLIDEIDTMRFLYVEPAHNRLPDILALIIQTQPNLLKKIMILSCRTQFVGKYGTGDRIPKATQSKQKDAQNSLLFESEQCKFNNLSTRIRECGNNCSMDFFGILKNSLDFESLKQPFVLSGGSIFIYDRPNNYSELYYDLFRVISRTTTFKTEIKCITGPGIKPLCMTFAQFVKNRPKVDLNSLNEDQSLCIYFRYNEKQFLGYRTSIQFIVSFKNHLGTHRRIINSSVYKCNQNQHYQVMAGFDPESAARLLLTDISISRHQSKSLSCRQKVYECMKKFKQFHFLTLYKMDEHKEDEKKQKYKDMSLRYKDSFGFFVSQCYSLLHRYPGFKCLSPLNTWKCCYSQYQMLTSPVEVTSKTLYPRVYELLEVDLAGKTRFDEMAATIVSDSTVFEKQSLVVADNGKKIFIYLNNVQPNTLQKLFGTDDLKLIEAMTHLNHSSDSADVFNIFIERLRQQTKSGCMAIQIMATSEKFSKYDAQIFIENPRKPDESDDFVRFMQYHCQQ